MVTEGVLKIIASIAVLLTSVPIGLFLSWLCSDELKNDRRYFYALSSLLLISAVFVQLFYKNGAVILSISYMVVVLFIMILKSEKK